MKKLKLKSVYVPTIMKANGKYQLVYQDGKFTRYVDDIPEDYNWRDDFEWVELYKFDAKEQTKEKVKLVKSKNSDNEYKVRYRKLGQNHVFDCSCPGAMYRGKCKHIDEFKKELKIK